MSSRSRAIALRDGVLLIGPIGDLQRLESEAHPSDLQSAEALHSPSRRTERLAWRALLRKAEPQATVEYDADGRPRIENSRFRFISVAHCRDCVVVMLSNERCGVDVERLDRNFDRAAERYIHPDERRLCHEEWWPAALWCAKEAIYKATQSKGLMLRDEVRITSFEGLESGQMSGYASGGRRLRLQLLMPDADHIVVYTL